MEKKKEILENFKTAIGSTVKSLSNSDNIEVSFGNQNIKSEKFLVRLPEIEHTNNKINYDQIRAIADSESLKLRFSDTKTFKSFEPNGNISKKMYKIAEKIRYEKIEIIDNSHKHKGHKFFSKEKYHLHLKIESLYLKSLTRLSAQKTIMNILKNDLKTKIHALEINIE